MGVYCKRIQLRSDRREEEQDAISDSAILLSAIVDAFGVIMNIYIEAVGDVLRDVKETRCGKKVSKSFKEAQDLLERARDELIVEASGVTSGEQIGPVVTPEAIIIVQIERLVCGVYKNGNADIISMFYQCLEQLVSTHETLIDTFQN